MTTSQRVAGLQVLAGGMIASLVALGIGRFAYTPLVPLMEDTLGYGSDVSGYIASANYWGYLAGAVAAFWLAKSARRLVVFQGALVCVIVTTGVMGVVDDPFDFGAIRFVAGVSAGLIIALGVAITKEAASHFGLSNSSGYFFSGVGVGIALTGAFSLTAGEGGDWQSQWIVLGVVSLLLSVPVWLWVGKFRTPTPTRASGTHGEGGGWPIAVWLVIVAYFLDGLGYVTSTTFLVSVASDLPELQGRAAMVWILVGVAAAPSCLIWFWVFSRANRFAVLIGLYLLQAGAVLWPAAFDDAVSILLAGLLFGATYLAAISLTYELAAPMAKGRGGQLFALLTVVFGTGQIVGPAVAGWLAERTGSFDGPLMMSAGAIFVAAVLLGIAGVSQHRSQQSQLKQTRPALAP